MNSCGFRRAEALLLGKARWNMNGKFELNDAVIYGSHGLCTLCEIAEKDFGGAARAYYVLRPAYSGSSVFYVPVDSEVLTAKMRRVKSAAELRALLGAAEDEDAWIEDDRARQNHLRQVLDGGDTKALLATLRSLYRRRVSLVGAGRKLRAADDRLLRDIEKLLLDELSLSFVLEREDLFPLLPGKAELCEIA